MLHRFTSFRFIGIAVTAIAAFGVLAPAATAHSGISPTFDASKLGGAIAADGGLVTGASFVTIPSGTSPAAVAERPLASFATDESSYAILSNGDPRLADDSNSKPDSGVNAGGGHFQGAHNYDTTVLRLDMDVPDGANCISFDYRFLSEEFSENVGGQYDDSFIAQLDRYDWNAGLELSAPGNFATDGQPIGVDSTGPYAMSAEHANGTTYDAATELISARKPAAPGPHSVYLSIFDQGDAKYDSAAFIDNLRATSESNCAPPIAPTSESPPVAVAPPAPPVAPPPVAPVELHSTISGLGNRIKANNLKYFSGNAAGDGIAKVQIALVGVKYGAQAAARRKSPRCVQINSKRQVFQRKPVARKCSRLEWLTVDGTRSWTFYLGRKLPKGNYTLYSRAVGDGGATQGNFSTTSGNRIAFTVY